MHTSLYKVLLIGLVSMTLFGCTTLWYRSGDKAVTSSLVDYLYPGGKLPPRYEETVPELPLPLRVGIAFVPGKGTDTPVLSEAKKNELLIKTRHTFQERPFIHDIVVIPDIYMRSHQGFDGLNQLGRLFALDIIALVSFDQVTHADDNMASILYWTVIGAYFIDGTKHETQTFVDVAVFDLKTHKLLLRAPGIDVLRESTGLVGGREDIRRSREMSFELAMADMTGNLDQELDRFKERIKHDNSVKLSYRSGYTGAGGFGLWDLALLVPLAAGVRRLTTRCA